MKGMLLVGILVAVAAFASVTMLVDDGTVDDDGYLYAVYTDADRNLDVIDVYESHYDGGTATVLSQVYRHSDAVDGIDQFWSFDRKTGVGPFNSFYAAINLSSDAKRDSYFDPRYPGDVTNSAKSGVNSITVGGRWDNTSFAGVAFACAGYDISEANEYRGARLAYLLSERDGGSGTCLSHRTDSPPLKPEVGSFDPSVSQNNCPMSRD